MSALFKPASQRCKLLLMKQTCAHRQTRPHARVQAYARDGAAPGESTFPFIKADHIRPVSERTEVSARRQRKGPVISAGESCPHATHAEAVFLRSDTASSDQAEQLQRERWTFQPCRGFWMDEILWAAASPQGDGIASVDCFEADSAKRTFRGEKLDAF